MRGRIPGVSFFVGPRDWLPPPPAESLREEPWWAVGPHTSDVAGSIPAPAGMAKDLDSMIGENAEVLAEACAPWAACGSADCSK